MKQSPIVNVKSAEGLSKGEKNRLRKEGSVPANISSKGSGSVSVILKQDEFLKLLTENGMSTVYRLQATEKEGWDVMVKEIDTAPLSNKWLHVNFQHVAMNEKTRAEIAIKILGKDAVMRKGLEVLQQLDAIQVRGLPGDMPNDIEVDVSGMAAGLSIMVKDLKLPEGIELETEGDREVVTVTHVKGHAEEPEAEEASAGAAAPQEAKKSAE